MGGSDGGFLDVIGGTLREHSQKVAIVVHEGWIQCICWCSDVVHDDGHSYCWKK